MVPKIDKGRVSAAVTAIEGVSDEQIHTLVNALPDPLMSAQDKTRIANGLIGRRNKVRQRMKAQGWLD